MLVRTQQKVIVLGTVRLHLPVNLASVSHQHLQLLTRLETVEIPPRSNLRSRHRVRSHRRQINEQLPLRLMLMMMLLYHQIALRIPNQSQ
jgi:hypothetical protein